MRIKTTCIRCIPVTRGITVTIIWLQTHMLQFSSFSSSWNKARWPPGCQWTTSTPHSISCKWRIIALIFFSLNASRLVLVFCVWWVWAVRQPCLPLAHVPVQTLGQAFEPVVHQVVAADGGHWVTGCGDLDTAERKRVRERITTQSMGKESVVRSSSWQIITSLHTGSPVSSCRQTTPRRCSWPRERGWSVWGWRGSQLASRVTVKLEQHANITMLLCLQWQY